MMKSENEELIERIQEHVDAKVIEAKLLEAREDASICEGGCEADQMIYPFIYRTDQCDYEMRGAFTNGDPIWEEEDTEAFQKMMGEE